MLVLVPYMTIWIGLKAWPVLKDAGRYGDFSYGIYLWAWPVQQTVVMLLGKDKPFNVLLSSTVIITIAFAFASWNLIEKRALKLKPSTG